MRICILIFLISFLTKVTYAQVDQRNPTPGSLAAQRANIDHINNAANSIFLSFPDSARKLAANSLLLSEKLNYSLGKGRSFYNIGLVYWSQSYYPISLFYFNSALSNLPKSNPLEISDCYKILGRTYADLGNYKLALHYLGLSLAFAGNDAGRIAEVYSERAHVYIGLKNYDKALATATYALKLNRVIKAKRNIAVLYGRLGVIYTGKKNYQKALAYNDIALKMSLEIKNRRLRAKTYVENAVISNQLHNFPEAISYAKKGVSLSDSLGNIEAETDAYNALVNSFEQKNELKKALSYQKKFNLIRDSLSGIAKLKTIKLIQNYYDLNAKINGIAVMQINDRVNKAKIKSQHILIMILILSLLVLMVILSATYYYYKQKKLLSTKLQHQHIALLDQKQLIEAQTINLQKVNNLKDKLLAVIGHDLRTPVANLSNIIEMFETGYLTTEDVHGLMKDINPVVKGAELTLSNLVDWAGSQIRGRSINSSNVDIFLLGVEMEQTFAHALQQKNIEFINHAYPGQAVLADENHLKVILRNLISNAIKFTDYKGSITLSTIIENNELITSVEDSGKGMTVDELNNLFFLDTHFSHSGTSGEKGTGIGLLLCKELVELNGGKIKVRSRVGKGSAFYFNLPLMKAYA